MLDRVSIPGISVVIPAWNEEDRLDRTLSQYLPVLESRENPFEVIVVIDGVVDRTAEVAERYAGRNVRVLRFPSKLGKGGAIIQGLKASRYEYVGYLDADGPIAPQQMFDLITSLDGADCAVASRWAPGASGVNGEPIFNRFAGRLWNLLTRSVLLVPIRDTQCGAKFFNHAAVQRVLQRVVLTNRAFDAILLFHARKDGLRLREVPVTWVHDRNTRMPIGRAIPVMFISLIGARVMNSAVSGVVPPKFVTWFQQRFGAT